MLIFGELVQGVRRGDAARLRRRKLDRCGSSGLGIKLGRFWTEIPEALVAKANELGFPLIELSYQFTVCFRNLLRCFP